MLGSNRRICVSIAEQFRYIKIQPNTIDLSTRLREINPTNSVVIPQSLVLRSVVSGWILIYRNWSTLTQLVSLPQVKPFLTRFLFFTIFVCRFSVPSLTNSAQYHNTYKVMYFIYLFFVKPISQKNTVAKVLSLNSALTGLFTAHLQNYWLQL